jgi:predicted dehydrogenase
MKKRINWAVVGTGGITHAFVQGLRVAEGAHIRAVVSRSAEGAANFAAQYGIPKTYADFEAMLNDDDIDVVYLGVPHSAHKELALPAFNAGKAVMDCLREGKQECEIMPPEESLHIAQIMDEVRASWGFRYPREK